MAKAATAARPWSSSSSFTSGRDSNSSARELPDYLPVVLEYLSCRDLAEAREMLADCAHILTTIGRSLVARRSRYAAVLQALIVIAGESPIDVAKVPPVKERTETLDRDWAEQPAFAGAPASADPGDRNAGRLDRRIGDAVQRLMSTRFSSASILISVSRSC